MIGFDMTKNIYLDLVIFIKKFVKMSYQNLKSQKTIGKMVKLIIRGDVNRKQAGKKSAKFINKINNGAKLFDKITVFEHPRYIQQYKSKEKPFYIDKYIMALSSDK